MSILIDPIIPALAAWRYTFEAYGVALAQDRGGNGDAPAAVAAGDAYSAAAKSAISTRPSTLAGVAAYARAIIDMAGKMGTDDYLHDGLAALARLDQH